MQKNVESLVKANALTIRFSMNYFISHCVENGTDNITFCDYLL